MPTHVRAHFGLDAPNSRFDTMLQGRGSYELALREGITRPFAHMREFVFSRTLSADIDPTVTVVADDPLKTVRALKAEPGPLGICLVGGPSIAGLLLPEIDEILLKRYPVVAGSGKTLFEGAEYAPAAFERVDRHDIERRRRLHALAPRGSDHHLSEAQRARNSGTTISTSSATNSKSWG